MSTQNPWQKKSSQSIYQGPWIRLRVDEVVRPDGLPGNYSVVELKGGVGVVVRDGEDRILLVGQYRYAPDCYSWEIPKGAFADFNSDEDPLVVAKRELKEETGVEAADWQTLGQVHTLMGSTNDKVYLFSATIESQGKSNPEGTEVIVVKWVSVAEFWIMVSRGEITDATSIAAMGIAESGILQK